MADCAPAQPLVVRAQLGQRVFPEPAELHDEEHQLVDAEEPEATLMAPQADGLELLGIEAVVRRVSRRRGLRGVPSPLPLSPLRLARPARNLHAFTLPPSHPPLPVAYPYTVKPKA